jgi:hypothetical protein
MLTLQPVNGHGGGQCGAQQRAGTHTGCTIAGAAHGTNSLTNPTPATGVAPGAKLAVFDVAFQELEDGTMEAFDDADPGVFYDIQRKVGRLWCMSVK